MNVEERKLKKQKANKERYEWLKAHHICVQCGSQEAFYNHVVCADCLYKKNELHHKNKDKNHATAQERRARYKAEGRCIDCGKMREGKSSLYCNEHLEKSRISKLRYSRKKLAERKLPPDVLHNILSERGKKNIKYAQESVGLKKWLNRKKNLIANEIDLHKAKKTSSI